MKNKILPIINVICWKNGPCANSDTENLDGDSLGFEVGSIVGSYVSFSEGDWVGSIEGCFVGICEGDMVGAGDGLDVGLNDTQLLHGLLVFVHLHDEDEILNISHDDE